MPEFLVEISVMSQSIPPQILIVGGGTAGIAVAAQLTKG